MKGYDLVNGTIIIDRRLTDLDLFVKDFIEILKKNTDYLIVSGYVTICTGRTRATEDVDIIVPRLKKETFESLFQELQKNEFWCYQGEELHEVYQYIDELESIRFAKKETLFPNIEFIPFDERKEAKNFEFKHPQKIRINGFEFKIPPIEFEILYKEIVLAGTKDKEDAKHLRLFFSEMIKEENFKRFKPIIERELK